MQRRGDWMITFTGKRFWPLDPRADEVCFADVAHALSMVCRYGGHVSRFYSVAEHSVLLARYFLRQGDRPKARRALAHDMPEAYTGDVVRPLKQHWQEARAIEARVADVVSEALGWPWSNDDIAAVDDADKRITVNEACAFWRPPQIKAAGWLMQLEPLPGVEPSGLAPEDAEGEFGVLFQLLFPDVAYA